MLPCVPSGSAFALHFTLTYPSPCPTKCLAQLQLAHQGPGHAFFSHISLSCMLSIHRTGTTPLPPPWRSYNFRTEEASVTYTYTDKGWTVAPSYNFQKVRQPRCAVSLIKSVT